MAACKSLILVVLALAAACHCTPWVQSPVEDFDLVDESGQLASYEDNDRAMGVWKRSFGNLELGQRVKACGGQLIAVLRIVCQKFARLGKRSVGMDEEMSNVSLGMLKRSSVSNDCCRQACAVDRLLEFCPKH